MFLIIRAIEEDPSLVQVTGSFGSMIFYDAVRFGRLQVMEQINNIDAHMKDRVNKYNGTPLMWASLKGQAATVKWLLHQDADLNIKDDDGDTALDYASNQEIWKMIKNK